MGLRLDGDAQQALDLAKRALPEGAELDPGLLLTALYYTTPLQDRLPHLARYLERPETRRETTPAKVPVAEPLQSVLQKVAENGEAVTANMLFRALLESDPGRQFLIERSMDDACIQEVMALLYREAPPEESAWRRSRERRQAIEALSSFGRMLTISEPPHRGVVEMERPLASLVRTLSKMKRHNAIIIGYPGTGKSALVYELARRLVEGAPSIPQHLRDLDIFELSPTFLRSGASVVGQYDERVKSLLEILRAHPKIVLFVDEIHSILQSGMHERTPFTDANEAFKSALSHGEISCIGCTTTAEYRHYIEPDGALERRFGTIRLDPPSPAATICILEARRPRLESYHAPLEIPDEMLKRIVELTETYLPGRFQPDKSIQLLEEACAFCVTMKPRAPRVSEEILWNALEDTIGHSVVRTQQLTEEEVFDQLRAKIIGQDETLRDLVRAFIAGLGGWRKTSAPRGVYMFCGPTGVGKTETALQLSRILGGGQEALVRIDCNTLQSSASDKGPAVNQLLGVPPGYLGYVRGQGGMLSRIRDHSESIVLFDEIEKAGPGVNELLLQIMDDGRIEDTEGNPLDFRRAFIIFTTNAGAVYDRRHIGFGPREEATQIAPAADVDSVKANLRALGFGEEFLGRIHHFHVFRGLETEAVERIIDIQLGQLHEMAELRGYRLAWDPEIVPHLTSQWQPRFGVRHLTTILRHRIAEQLGVAEAQGELRGITEIRLQVPSTMEGTKEPLPAGLATRERQDETLIINLT